MDTKNFERQFGKQSLKSIRENFFNNDIFGFINEKLTKIGVVEHEIMIPLYLSSVGAHILNLINVACARVEEDSEIDNKKPKLPVCKNFGTMYCPRTNLFVLRHGEDINFYKVFGQVPDLRVHLLHVAPSGFSKDFFMSILMDNEFGILPQEIPHTIVRGFLSEAGYIGTKTKDNKGNTITIKGLAEMYCAGIIGVPEFSTFMMAMKQTHSMQLENDLLELLQGGKINKIMANGTIEFNSYHTLWAGTQPSEGRLDVSTGLGRRLNFYLYLPNKEEQEEYKKAQFRGRFTSFSTAELAALKKYLAKLWETRAINRVEFTNAYEEFRNSLEIINHTNIQLYDNIALGYNFINNFDATEEVVEVKIDDLLKKILMKVATDRANIMREAYIEWQVILPIIFESDKPLKVYDVVRTIEKTQMLSYKDIIEKLTLAEKEGVVGFFKVDRVHGGTDMYVYDTRKFKSVEDAMRSI